MTKGIIIHCSDSSFGNASVINDWHKERGFDKIGYHFVILNGSILKDKYKPFCDGLVETGRDVDELGAHTKGYNEKIGICLIGKSGKFTRMQLESLRVLISELRKSIEITDISQHSDWDEKKPYCAGLHNSLIEAI